MKSNKKVNNLLLCLGASSVLYACNSGNGSPLTSTSSNGGSVSVATSQIPANFGNRGNPQDFIAPVTNMSVKASSGESSNVIIGYNSSITSMSNQQCYNYTVTPGGVSLNSGFTNASLVNTLEKNFSIGGSIAGSVANIISGNLNASYSSDSSANSFTQSNTYVYQLSYPLTFSGISLNSTGTSMLGESTTYGLNCGSNVITSVPGNFTVFIEILANSDNSTDSQNFKQALSANVSSFAGLAESVGYANSNASSGASVQVSVTIVGGNSSNSQILTVLQESTGQQCLKTGNTSTCEQWNSDISSALTAAQSSISSEVSAGNVSSLHFDLAKVTSVPVSDLISSVNAVDPYTTTSSTLIQLSNLIKTLNYINLRTTTLMNQIGTNLAYQVAGNYAMLDGVVAPGFSTLLQNLASQVTQCIDDGASCTLTSQTLADLFKNYSGQPSSNLKYLENNFYALQTVGYYNYQPQLTVTAPVASTTSNGTVVSVTPMIVENTSGSTIVPELMVFNSQSYYDNYLAATNSNGVGFVFPNVTDLAALHNNSSISGSWYSNASGQIISPFSVAYLMDNGDLGCNLQTNDACSVTLSVGANCSESGFTAAGYYCANGTAPIYYQPSQVYIEYNPMVPPYIYTN